MGIYIHCLLQLIKIQICLSFCTIAKKELQRGPEKLKDVVLTITWKAFFFVEVILIY